MSESLIFTKIERALLSIKEVLPWFSKDSLNYQCLVKDIKNYGEECRDEGLKDGKRHHHISIADIDTVSKLYGEIKELKQTLDVERHENKHLKSHIKWQEGAIQGLKKNTWKRKDLKHKIARLEIDVKDRDNVISHLEAANRALGMAAEARRVERDGFERCLKEAQGKIENLKAALQRIILEDLEGIRRRNRESEPMTVSIHGIGRISDHGIIDDHFTRDAYLIRDLHSHGYAVSGCPFAVKAIKAHLDKAFHHGKDIATREYSSQIEFLQGKVKQRDSIIEQLKDRCKKLDEANKAQQEELNSLEAMHFRSDEHMVKTIDRLTSELKAAKSNTEWHDTAKLLPYGHRRLHMHAKGIGAWGEEIHFTGYGKAVHGDSGAMAWMFEKGTPFDDGAVVRWRYADE